MPSLLKMGNGRACPYCQRAMMRLHPRLQPTRDHVMPKCEGGRAIVICCLDCNRIKANMLPALWSAFMIANPGWWQMSNHQLRVRKRMLFNTGAPADTPALAVKVVRYQRQGLPPTGPVVVPPNLVWPSPERPILKRSDGEVPESLVQGVESLDASLAFSPDDG